MKRRSPRELLLVYGAAIAGWPLRRASHLIAAQIRSACGARTGSEPARESRTKALAPPALVSLARNAPVAVSIVVSTLDRASSLERLLQSLEALTYPKLEVIIVEGPCRDATHEVIARWKTRIVHRKCPTVNLSRSRNVGIAAAHGDIIAFIDDDATPEPDWLDQIVAAFQSPDVAACGGSIRDHSGVALQAGKLYSNGLTEISTSPVRLRNGGNIHFAFTGTNFCARRDALIGLGGFDETFNYFLEETDMQMRLQLAGYRLAYVSEAEVHHAFEESRVRTKRRVPKSYGTIFRSMTYFCLTHYGLTNREDVITWRITRKLAALSFRLAEHVARGHIKRNDARALWLSALRGVGRGARAYAKAANAKSRPLARSGASGNGFFDFRAQVGARLRFGFVVCEPASEAARAKWTSICRELGARGCEVSVFSRPFRSHRVYFLDRHWRHELRKGDSIDQEIERVATHRRFQLVLDVVADDAGSAFTLKLRGAVDAPVLCRLSFTEIESALAERIFTVLARIMRDETRRIVYPLPLRGAAFSGDG